MLKFLVSGDCVTIFHRGSHRQKWSSNKYSNG